VALPVVVLSEDLGRDEFSALYPIMTARCCREWPVFAYNRIGRCGECGDRPVIDVEPWK
jgi:hypothetical protein